MYSKNTGYKFKSGFTLIELLVVVAIIGVLASVILAMTSDGRMKSRDARRHSDVKQIKNALELYYADHGIYPIGSWWDSNNSGWNTLQTALSPYINSLPHDPKETSGFPYLPANYVYGYFSSGYGCPGGWYMLVYQLETAKGIDSGVRSCDGTYFRYGGAGANTTIKTVGSSAR